MRGVGMGILKGGCVLASFVLRILLCFLQVGNLGEVSIRIFISFLGVSFNMLTHQNECIEMFEIVLWSASPLSWICLALIGYLVNLFP